MIYRELPDEDGYYWVECEINDRWYLCYLDVETEEPRCRLLDKLGTAMFENQGNGWQCTRSDEKFWPKRWIGPLREPGGPFGGSCAYFDLETYEASVKQGKAAVMVYTDHGEKGHGAVTHTGLMPYEDAVGAGARAFRDERVK